MSYLVWWALRVVGAPVFVLFVSPVIALLIRQAVSQVRELLADADAVRLTRDPEGLALALVKIGAAGGHRLPVIEGCVHLYFADPVETSALHQIFPSHPPLAGRIDVLARMGSGIAPSALKAARDAGEKFRNDQPLPVDLDAPRSMAEELNLRSGEAPPHLESGHQAPCRIEDELTPIYEHPDGWSRVVARVPANTSVTPIRAEGKFIRVITKDNVTGYVAASARLVGLTPVQR